MTDQRNRVTTDPGLGPIEPEHHSTLRSIVAADPVIEELVPEAASVYFGPKPLHAVSEHKTLELETVKLAKDIDPRKLPTELKLRRPVLHVLPASDPNWPAPAPPQEMGWQQPQFDVGWPPPQFDSGWPPPETVLTTSQPPASRRRRSYIPLVMLFLLGASLLVVLGATARRRSARAGAAAQRAQTAGLPVVASPKLAGAPPRTPPELANGESVLANAAPAGSAADAVAPATSADPMASATSTPLADAPHHTLKPPSPSQANSRALSAPVTTKPKRAIY
ncbi:MAG TPA: hypothetical protein VJV79_25030 [Polyangiaceae bacterium]|nr:hypothetical protein [Polyangiaceae bacterium]